MGVLNKVEHLPPRRIPSKCRHSDILKNIMLNCSDLSFKRIFSHVRAHQEDTIAWEKLSREAQLNCGCDLVAKEELIQIDLSDIPPQRQFPLEPIALFIDGHKITTESGPTIRYATQLKEAKSVFHKQKVLLGLGDTFDDVAWKHVHRTLHTVPKMFQFFACKQVFHVSATFDNLRKQSNRAEKPSAHCPSSGVAKEKGGHILLCSEEGRIEALNKFSDKLAETLVDAGTERDLIILILNYIREPSSMTMVDICREHSLPDEYRRFAQSQDQIRWRRFLDGMISKELSTLVFERDVDGEIHSISNWMQNLITNLLELTHGMWIYRNVVVHDKLEGFLCSARKRVASKGDRGAAGFR